MLTTSQLHVQSVIPSAHLCSDHAELTRLFETSSHASKQTPKQPYDGQSSQQAASGYVQTGPATPGALVIPLRGKSGISNRQNSVIGL